MSEHKKLMRMTARAFYATSYAKERLNAQDRKITLDGAVKVDRKTKLDDPRIVEVVVDALTRRTWTREDYLASDLKLSFKQTRKLLTYLEREKLVTRAHVKEKDRVRAQALAERGIVGAPDVKKTVSWASLNYGRMLDVVRYRLHVMKKQARQRVDKGKIHEVYVCIGPR